MKDRHSAANKTLSVAHICCDPRVWQGRGGGVLRTWACIRIKDNFVTLSVACLTACLCLPLQMEVDADDKRHRTRSKGIHTHTHSGIQLHCYSGWPSLPQHKQTHGQTQAEARILYTHHCTNPRLSQLSSPFSPLSLVSSLVTVLLPKQNLKSKFSLNRRQFGHRSATYKDTSVCASLETM